MRHGATLVVMGEHEIAKAMIDHAGGGLAPKRASRVAGRLRRKASI